MNDVDTQLKQALERLDLEALRNDYLAQDELIALDGFLPPALLEKWREELQALRPHIHRNFIPRHKKGGSVDFNTLSRHAPTIRAVYASPVFFEFLKALTGAPIGYCPETDLHRCALYAYTEAGDHIGWHYDTSYYRGRRFTVLIGLKDAPSCRLLYRLNTKREGHDVVEGASGTPPGCLIVFNGDKLHHAVSPLAEGEERFIVTMEYVTDTAMNPFLRFVSNMKDAVAYFGFRKVFSRDKAA